jgi:imidazolonepropionase-like amidohydrolase
MGYQPTIQAGRGLLAVLESDFLARPGVADAYPRALIDWYASPEAGWFARELRANVGDSGAATIRTLLGRASQVVGALARADGTLLFGTDTPSDPTYAEPPGYNGRLEMDNWIAAGVSASKLLRAMTIDNARRLRLDDRIGTIEPGKVAHLLLLRADPLESVEAYDTIETVFLRGRPLPRETLSARRVPATGN